jgi:hypothetical protein
MYGKKAQAGKKIAKPFKSEMGKPMTAAQKKKQQADELKMVDYPGRPAMPEINYKGGPKVKKKMKSGGKAFPDLNKDGKVTKADILVGRGVIKAKKGVKMKKAQAGMSAAPSVSLRARQLKRIGRLSAKDPDKAKEVGSRMVERATRRQRGKEFIKKNLSELMPQSRKGSKLKKAQFGVAAGSLGKSSSMKKKPKSTSLFRGMKSGGSMGKCRYGCK